MSFTQLEYFVAVAEEGTLTRAAHRLHVSQPPLTRQIRSLEEELGATLFARTPRGMTLLPRGALFLDHARGLLAARESARRALQGTNDTSLASSRTIPGRRNADSSSSE